MFAKLVAFSCQTARSAGLSASAAYGRSTASHIRLWGRHANKPLFIELCAGTAGVSAALIACGFDAVAIDHKCVPGAKTAIYIADLCSPQGFALAKRFVLRPRCIGFLAAPVCGTASRAREIITVDGPRPLRSEELPDGLPDLTTPSERERVTGGLTRIAVRKYHLSASTLQESIWVMVRVYFQTSII